MFIPEACFDDAMNDDYCDCWLCRTEGSQCDGYDCICTYPSTAAPGQVVSDADGEIGNRMIKAWNSTRVAPRSGE